MRNLIVILLTMFITNTGIAQKITYHNQKNQIVTKEEATYYQVIEKLDKKLYHLEQFYMNGSIAVSGFLLEKRWNDSSR